VASAKSDDKPAEQSAKPAQLAQNGQSSGDWLRALASNKTEDAPPQDIAKDNAGKSAPASETKMAEQADAPAESPAASTGSSSQLMGEMSDKELLKLVSPTQPDKAAPAEDTQKAEAPPPEEEARPTPKKHRSFFSRLFGRSDSDEKAADNTVAAVPAEKVETKDVEEPQAAQESAPQESASEQQQDNTAAAQPEETAPEAVAKQEDAQPVTEEASQQPAKAEPEAAPEATQETEKPKKHRRSFFARLFGSGSRHESHDEQEAPLPPPDGNIGNADTAASNTQAAASASPQPAPGEEKTSAAAETAPEAPAPENNAENAAPEDSAPEKQATEATAASQEKPAVLHYKAPDEDTAADMHNDAEHSGTASANESASEETPAKPAAEPDRPSFFARLFGAHPKTQEENTEAKPSDSSPAAPVQDSAAGGDQPVVTLAPAAPVVTSSAPVMAVTTGDGAAPAGSAAANAAANNAEAAAPAAGASSLPSPKILEQVKMMPVSRYSARAKALRHHADED
jgi:hypothetical protein